MKKVPITDVSEGDVLARDLRAQDQSMILAKGAVLSASMLVRLSRMGVAALTIETDAAQTAEETEKQRIAIENRFAGHEADPYLMEMKRVVLARHDIFQDLPKENLTQEPQNNAPIIRDPPAEPGLAQGAARIKLMKDRVSRVLQIQALPDSVARIIKLLNNMNARSEDISREISRDPAFSAQVLKLVNSGFYGLSQSVTSIAHATVLLGFNVMKTIVMSASVFGMMAEAMTLFWKHSIACSRTCTLLARRLGMPEPEEFSTIGLLHDIGKIVMAQFLKDDFKTVMDTVRADGCLFIEAERRALGVTHVDVAQWLLENWKLPPETITPIIKHHDFDLENPFVVRVAVVHLADVLIRAEGFGSGDVFVPPLNPAVMQVLKLEKDHLQGIMDEMRVELFDIE